MKATSVEEKKVCLLVGDHLPGTGFHRVVEHIKKAIGPHFEVHHIGIAYEGQTFVAADGTTIYPGNSANGGPHGHKHIARLIDQLNPDLFLLVYDLIFARFLLEALRHKKPGMIAGAYLALDGRIVKRRKMIAPLKVLDFCVWYTDYALEQVQHLLQEQPSLLARPVDFRVIPHGVAANTFYPLAEDDRERRIMARQQVFPDLESPENTFIVLNGNTFSARKRIDLTLRAFAQFAKNKSSQAVKLYLHKAFFKGEMSGEIISLVEELQLEPYLLCSPYNDQLTVDDSTMNLIYNACDVGINTCMGEGWGLVSCEHGATRAAQILPHHTVFPEIWQDHAAWVAPTETTEVGYTPHLMHQLKAEPFAEALEKLYTHQHLKDALAQGAYRTMNAPQFQWANIEKQWESLLLEVTHRPNHPLHTHANPSIQYPP